MKYLSLVFIILAGLLLSNCTIYRSPERKEFESESPGFTVQNLKQLGCANSSMRSKSQSSRLITIYQSANSESHFLWEYRVGDESYFESDNLNGVYCAFENS
ncbi:MAG: hypothetical protein A2622_11365 [Bdellovibrionales bacterium RIFCSPHIGHO2_01_FULL_40_29]|nr:MAG: hypothetical protein A2622_11365 [Bdellovibrionales bacterium RIFCSPHIGHO2_01_FULL_40_29]OFZ34547.1 MAG: hypothetical protein A3D17_01630 [Bdellovibrionales bacterium RIFCSPHIGHO2_02_FULL_40_15]